MVNTWPWPHRQTLDPSTALTTYHTFTSLQTYTTLSLIIDIYSRVCFAFQNGCIDNDEILYCSDPSKDFLFLVEAKAFYFNFFWDKTVQTIVNFGFKFSRITSSALLLSYVNIYIQEELLFGNHKKNRFWVSVININFEVSSTERKFC